MHTLSLTSRVNGSVLVDSSAVSTPSSCVDPAQTTSSQSAGSSRFTTPFRRKSTSASNKRKRTDTPEECPDSSQQQPQQKKNREGPKKKKANRACFHCQKAHLTCDDSRPCQRCVKRGIADNCTEGHRKKAKYLLDEEELEKLKRSKSSAPESTTEPVVAPVPVTTSDPFSPNDPMFNVAFDPNFAFGSEAANLEYSILSAILGNPSPPGDPAPSPPPQYPQGTYSLNQSQYSHIRPSAPTTTYDGPFSDQQLSIQPSDITLSSPSDSSRTQPNIVAPYPSSAHYQQRPAQQSPPQDDVNYNYSSYQPPYLHPLQPRYPHQSRSPPLVAAVAASTFSRNNQFKDSRTLGSPLSSQDSPTSSGDYRPHGPRSTASLGSQLQTINDRVTSPYDYTQGYHFLMKHLPSRFEKNDILRVVRALAIYRPSLIALQMPLSEEDEVFVERCFQRSLLELEKLISFSGTPTVAWRRTGEICLVAPEFCLLTEWSMEELMGGRKYIYELFENQSVVEYWENFASHAFENTTTSVYSHCVLLKPSGAPIPSTFCFSIRRDIFDLPSLVIGQWLPLL